MKKVITYGTYDLLHYGHINLYDVDPFDFIRLVRDAKYIVTDSFHGSVFSILFQKKFMTFYRKDPNAKGSTHSRIDSLFNIFGLSNRLFKTNLYSEIQQDIDYEYTNEVLAQMREESIKFLSDSLLLSK